MQHRVGAPSTLNSSGEQVILNKLGGGSVRGVKSQINVSYTSALCLHASSLICSSFLRLTATRVHDQTTWHHQEQRM